MKQRPSGRPAPGCFPRAIERGVDQGIEGIWRRVGVDGACQSAAGVDCPSQLESLSSPDLADDYQVGAHSECGLDQLPQADLPASVQRWGPGLVIRPMDDRDIRFPDLLACPNAVIRWDSGDQCKKRNEVLPAPGGPLTITEVDARMARLRKSAAPRVSDPTRPRRRESPSGARNGGWWRRDGRTPAGSPQSGGPTHRGFEPGTQGATHRAADRWLPSAARLPGDSPTRSSAHPTHEPTPGFEKGHSVALDEDLLHILAVEKIHPRSEVGDGLEQAADCRIGVCQRIASHPYVRVADSRRRWPAAARRAGPCIAAGRARIRGFSSRARLLIS